MVWTPHYRPEQSKGGLMARGASEKQQGWGVQERVDLGWGPQDSIRADGLGRLSYCLARSGVTIRSRKLASLS